LTLLACADYTVHPFMWLLILIRFDGLALYERCRP